MHKGCWKLCREFSVVSNCQRPRIAATLALHVHEPEEQPHLGFDVGNRTLVAVLLPGLAGRRGYWIVHAFSSALASEGLHG